MKGACFGWDIGGAHVKIASLDSDGRLLAVRQLACPLWQGVAQLEQACDALDVANMAPDAVHGVTMTGELCDVFADRASGVRDILACLGRKLNARATLRVYAGAQGWLSAAAARHAAAAVASANWLALAHLVATEVDAGVLLDIGSTTTDVILIEHGAVQCQGHDDATRLASGELIYTGMVRTPLMAVCRRVPVRGVWQNLAAEYFATMADVYRVLGVLDERLDQMATADGRAKDIPASARRVARMLGRDYLVDATHADMLNVAQHFARVQAREIEDAVVLQASRAAEAGAGLPIVGAGAGAWLAEQIALRQARPYSSFAAMTGAEGALASDAVVAAPAVAVAKLAWRAR